MSTTIKDDHHSWEVHGDEKYFQQVNGCPEFHRNLRSLNMKIDNYRNRVQHLEKLGVAQESEQKRLQSVITCLSSELNSKNILLEKVLYEKYCCLRDLVPLQKNVNNRLLPGNLYMSTGCLPTQSLDSGRLCNSMNCFYSSPKSMQTLRNSNFLLPSLNIYEKQPKESHPLSCENKECLGKTMGDNKVWGSLISSQSPINLPKSQEFLPQIKVYSRSNDKISPDNLILNNVLASVSQSGPALNSLNDNNPDTYVEVIAARQAASIANATVALSHGFESPLPLPESLYLKKCFDNGIEPHSQILRSLRIGDEISITDPPAQNADLIALLKAYMLGKSTGDPNWAHFSSLILRCALPDAAMGAGDLIKEMPSLRRIKIFGIDNDMLKEIMTALILAPNIMELSFPESRLTDVGVKLLMRTVHQCNAYISTDVSDSCMSYEKCSEKSVDTEQLDKNHNLELSTKYQASQMSSSKIEVIPRLNNPSDKTQIPGEEGISPHKSSLNAVEASKDLSFTYNLRLAVLGLFPDALIDTRTLKLFTGPALHSLYLPRCSILTDSWIDSIVRNCPNLHSLQLSECTQLTDKICITFNKAPNLTEVWLPDFSTISTIKVDHIRILFSNCHNVVRLIAPHLVLLPLFVTHFVFLELYLPAIEKILFKNLSFGQREIRLLVNSISDSLIHLAFINCRFPLGELCLIFSRAKQLRHLSLHGSFQMSQEDWISIPTTLQSLDLGHHFLLDDDSLRNICDICPNIQWLSLKACRHISKKGLLHLSKLYCLQYLNILLLRHIPNDTLTEVIRSFSYIQRIVHESFISSGEKHVVVDRCDFEEEEKIRYLELNQQHSLVDESKCLNDWLIYQNSLSSETFLK